MLEKEKSEDEKYYVTEKGKELFNSLNNYSSNKTKNSCSHLDLGEETKKDLPHLAQTVTKRGKASKISTSIQIDLLSHCMHSDEYLINLVYPKYVKYSKISENTLKAIVNVFRKLKMGQEPKQPSCITIGKFEQLKANYSTCSGRILTPAESHRYDFNVKREKRVIIKKIEMPTVSQTTPTRSKMAVITDTDLNYIIVHCLFKLSYFKDYIYPTISHVPWETAKRIHAITRMIHNKNNGRYEKSLALVKRIKKLYNKIADKIIIPSKDVAAVCKISNHRKVKPYTKKGNDRTKISYNAGEEPKMSQEETTPQELTVVRTEQPFTEMDKLIIDKFLTDKQYLVADETQRVHKISKDYLYAQGYRDAAKDLGIDCKIYKIEELQ